MEAKARIPGDSGRRPRPEELVAAEGGTWSAALGIALDRDDAQELFKWFLASLLLGARISGTLALRAWHCLMDEGMSSPQALQEAGWDRLVQILDRGGYARYDFKTATKLLAASKSLLECYDGDLRKLRDSAHDHASLERALRSLASGIGEVTVNIFLRELRGRWPCAQPLPSARVVQAAAALRYVPATCKEPARVLARLQSLWQRRHGDPARFPEFEAALLRYQLEHR